MYDILVIDDEEDILSVAEEYLEIAGFKVIALVSAVKALEMLEGGLVVDGIVCDLVMPQMNGITFFKTLKEKGLLINPFVLITGFASESPEAKALLSEGLDYIFEKPLQIYDIGEYLKKYIERTSK
jgi:CheY-like chemotaxis protein